MGNQKSLPGAVLVFPAEKNKGVKKLCAKTMTVLSWEELYQCREDLSSFFSPFEAANLFVFGPPHTGQCCPALPPTDPAYEVLKLSGILGSYCKAKGVVSVILVAGKDYSCTDWRKTDAPKMSAPLFMARESIQHLNQLVQLRFRDGVAALDPRGPMDIDKNVIPQEVMFPSQVPKELKEFVRRHDIGCSLTWHANISDDWRAPVAQHKLNINIHGAAAWYMLNGPGRAFVLPLRGDLSQEDIQALVKLPGLLSKLDALLPFRPECIVPNTLEAAGLFIPDEATGAVELRAFGKECSFHGERGRLLIHVANSHSSITEPQLTALLATTLGATQKTFNRIRAELRAKTFSDIEIFAIISRCPKKNSIVYRMGDVICKKHTL